MSMKHVFLKNIDRNLNQTLSVINHNSNKFYDCLNFHRTKQNEAMKQNLIFSTGFYCCRGSRPNLNDQLIAEINYTFVFFGIYCHLGNKQKLNMEIADAVECQKKMFGVARLKWNDSRETFMTRGKKNFDSF
jgi:hypothetical protein